MTDVHALYTQQLTTKVDYGSGPRLPINKRNLQKFLSYESWGRDGIMHDIPHDRLFFASDHHFGHSNIIKYAGRPFADSHEMDTCLIERHNDIVGPNDYVVFGGDIAFSPTSIADRHLSQMHGYKIFILGNHDFERSGEPCKYAVDEGHLYWHVPNTNEEFNMVFTHYPLDGLSSDTINLHGHIHEKISDNPQHVNVCVEHTEYAPLSMNRVLEIARMRFIEMQG